MVGFWMANTIYVLNVPDLDLSGTGEPETDAQATLSDVEKLCGKTAESYGLRADCRQSNREGELIDFIYEAQAKKAVGIIINAGGYSRSSMALHDALAAARIPAVEVHVSNIHARENFRHDKFAAKVAFASLSGFGIDGYRLAINGLAAKIGAKAAA
jgi:3-dehydroquinate dehydratase II